MSTLIVDSIVADLNAPAIPLTELGFRVINSHQQWYDGGYWRNDNTYNWVPGLWHDYTPISASSRIRVNANFTYCGPNGSAHNISHWIFYANGVDQGKHSVSGYHLEGRGSFIWDFASWGTSQGRIGYQMRQYAYTNHEITVHSTRYWDGGGSNQNCRAHLIIEEYLTQGL